MKIYKIASLGYHYLTNCIGAEGDDIREMVEQAIEINYNTFLKYVSVEEVKNIFDYYEWGRGNGLKLKDDYAVRYFKSVFKEKLCVYIKHSAIEYIYVK